MLNAGRITHTEPEKTRCGDAGLGNATWKCLRSSLRLAAPLVDPCGGSPFDRVRLEGGRGGRLPLLQFSCSSAVSAIVAANGQQRTSQYTGTSGYR
ncbi:hypothetical protein NDU88_011482 [Pleurodeles waltl]|uniref:Uncharacterized protein n=1 Tax=Pleurodeles waltl TaxID=8319 RepID=A0AAV7S5J9_PLEWA|nr:hypothetical protein NDU88_011482 [Pleurodeles waltl]